MFLYWDGYEIDGSDTAFDITLPENIQTWEFVKCFLDIPIFTDTPEPEYIRCHTDCHDVWHSEACTTITRSELKDLLLSGVHKQNCSIKINFKHPDLLSDELRTQIYTISANRQFNKDETPFDHTKAVNPCTAPVIQNFFDYGGFTMQLLLYEQKDGRITASVHVGPGAYYEYTMFVLEYMRERFPSVGIDLDGGFQTCECNFAGDYLYQYEKVQLPVKQNIKFTLKWLAQYGLMSYRPYRTKGWKRKFDYEATGYFAATLFWNSTKTEQNIMSIDDYLERVEMVAADKLSTAKQIIATAVNILLPEPERFAESAEAVSLLANALQPLEQTEWNKDWASIFPRTGYMSFYTVDGVTTCELRVRANMKAYLQTWLNLAESGAIDFIKPKTSQ